MTKLLLIAAIMAVAWLYLRKPAARPAPRDRGARDPGRGSQCRCEAIRAAHRRLAAAVHPDKGGSADLTRRINAARDTLLKR
ncbi:MAG: J domain-containing protein [Sphingomonas sp.]